MSTVGEQYVGGSAGKVYIPPYQLRRMKKNMQKVPKIQQKAEAYTQKELASLEQEFNDKLDTL